MIRFADSLKKFEESYGGCEVAYLARELARHIEELHHSSGDAVAAAAYAAGAAIQFFREEGHRVRRRVFTIATDVLDEAIRLGKHPTIVPERAAQRLSETMRKAPDLVEA